MCREIIYIQRKIYLCDRKEILTTTKNTIKIRKNKIILH